MLFMDTLTKEQRSSLMSRVRSKNTMPEITLKKAIRGLGFSYQPKIIGGPDFLHRKGKVAIFVHGCFWHKCPKHYSEPKSRKKYWIPKVEDNVKRDKRNVRLLRKNGYSVLTIWEHDIKKDVEKCSRRIKAKLTQKGV